MPEVHHFFLSMAIMLLAAKFFAAFAKRFGIPTVIGELAAGVLLGPSLFGLVSPTTTLHILAEIGIVLLLFEVGMDTDIFRLARSGAKPFIVALAGFLAPFLSGFLAGFYLFGQSPVASLFIGGTLTATSIGITVRVLRDLNRQGADEAQIVIGAAVVDDILGVIALAFLYDFALHGKVTVVAAGEVGLFVVLFMVLAPVVAKILAEIIDRFDRNSESPGLLISLVVSLILLFSYLAHVVGAPAIMGGFAAGIAMGQRFRIEISRRLGLPFTGRLNRFLSRSPELSHRLEEQMRPLIHLFSPIFFVMVGVSLNLKSVDWSSATVWVQAGVLAVLAFAGKGVAGFCIRESRLRQFAIGLSMVPRGEVGLIFAQLGLQNGIFGAELYAALLIVIALTTALPPFALKWYYAKYGNSPELVSGKLQ